jgi:P-type Ca2+ transporter type 2B
MLWVNLIMDTFAAMALATESPKEDIIKGKPYPKDDNIITPVMWRNILGQSFFQILVLSVLLFGGSFIFGVEFRRPDEVWTPETGYHYTIIFNTFIFMQIFNEVNCRKIGEHGNFIIHLNLLYLELNVFENFFNNSMFLFIIGLTFVVQIILIEYGGEAVKCTSLTIGQHLMCIGIGFLSIVFGYFAKRIPLSYFKGLRLNEEQSQNS